MGSTLKQIARETGVAISTVSRALNAHPHVDELTRRRVLEAADRLGYRPNSVARALRGQGTRSVGVVLPDVMNHFYARTVAVLQEGLEDRGYGVVLAVTGNDPARERAALERLSSASVDGILIVPSIPRNPPTPADIPLLELNRRSSRAGVDVVLYDEDAGAADLVEHLVALGHRRIAYLGGEAEFSTTRRRLTAYRQVLATHGLEQDPELLQLRTHTRAWGVEGFGRLMRCDDPPSAVFAASSELALGLLVEARRIGVRVPEDVSVVAFGNPDWYEVVTPPLTCYEQPLEEVGMIAVQLLLSRIGGAGAGSGSRSGAPTEVVVRGRCIERTSTCPA